jgi:RecG-like helicase
MQKQFLLRKEKTLMYENMKVLIFTYNFSKKIINNYVLNKLSTGQLIAVYNTAHFFDIHTNIHHKPYLTNVHMKQNSRPVSPLSILVPKSLVPTYYRTNDTPQNSLVWSCKGTKEQWSKKNTNLMDTPF